MIEKGNGQQTAYRKVRFEMVPMDEVREMDSKQHIERSDLRWFPWMRCRKSSRRCWRAGGALRVAHKLWCRDSRSRCPRLVQPALSRTCLHVLARVSREYPSHSNCTRLGISAGVVQSTASLDCFS